MELALHSKLGRIGNKLGMHAIMTSFEIIRADRLNKQVVVGIYAGAILVAHQYISRGHNPIVCRRQINQANNNENMKHIS